MRKALILTKAPLILAGEASEMYRGAVIDAIPTPKPTNTLPSMILLQMAEMELMLTSKYGKI